MRKSSGDSRWTELGAGAALSASYGQDGRAPFDRDYRLWSAGMKVPLWYFPAACFEAGASGDYKAVIGRIDTPRFLGLGSSENRDK